VDARVLRNPTSLPKPLALETAASKLVESPTPVSGDWLPTPEIARNRAVSRESKRETGLRGWGERPRTQESVREPVFEIS
jgi:hypothetical protein